MGGIRYNRAVTSHQWRFMDVRSILTGARPLRAVFLLSAGCFVASGCAELDSGYGGNYPYGGGGGSYGGPYGGYGSYDDRHRDRYEYERDRAADERRRLEWERRRLEDERRRLEDERRHDHYNPPVYNPPPPPRQEQCPSGFHPTSRNCTSEERKKRGCKDIRVSPTLKCINI